MLCLDTELVVQGHHVWIQPRARPHAPDPLTRSQHLRPPFSTTILHTTQITYHFPRL